MGNRHSCPPPTPGHTSAPIAVPEDTLIRVDDTLIRFEDTPRCADLSRCEDAATVTDGCTGYRGGRDTAAHVDLASDSCSDTEDPGKTRSLQNLCPLMSV